MTKNYNFHNVIDAIPFEDLVNIHDMLSHILRKVNIFTLMTFCKILALIGLIKIHFKIYKMY